ncbi:MAG: hypothetical protein ACREDH_16300, partial [Methylocella sp.]
MRVALHTTFAAGKKQPLAALLERVRTAFIESGLGEPTVQFVLSEAPVQGFVSSVDRALKRFPELERLVSTPAATPLGGPVRQISNLGVSSVGGEGVTFATLLSIAAGVPKSFPFHYVAIRFADPAFGTIELPGALAGGLVPGIVVGDSWWVNGRQRALSALTIVDADPASKQLPSLPGPVAAVLAACGKVKKTVQVPLPDAPVPTPAPAATSAGLSPEAAAAVRAVVIDYRARYSEILDRAALPHDLPDVREARADTPFGQRAGLLKPALVRAFKPMGYDCRGGSGTFTLIPTAREPDSWGDSQTAANVTRCSPSLIR